MPFLTSAFEQEAAMACPDRNYLSENSDVRTRRDAHQNQIFPNGLCSMNLGVAISLNYKKIINTKINKSNIRII